jgi:hypothetical protein
LFEELHPANDNIRSVGQRESEQIGAAPPDSRGERQTQARACAELGETQKITDVNKCLVLGLFFARKLPFIGFAGELVQPLASAGIKLQIRNGSQAGRVQAGGDSFGKRFQ